MKTYLLSGTMTALTSVSHIGETQGITSMLRREKIVQPDGSSEEVPIISGNSIRGILRDKGMMYMLRRLGYGVNEETNEVDGLSLAAFYFLFSGGALTKSGRGIDVDEGRRWRETIPLVAVFGGAMGNQTMPGKLKVGKLIPVCAETRHLLPERYQKQATASVWEMCQREAYTRRDDEKNENMRYLIAPQDRLLLQSEWSGEKKAPDHKQQMRFFVETLCAGTMFFWEVAMDDATDLEFEAFLSCIVQWGRAPYIGGKSSVGHGKMQLHLDDWLTIDPRLAPNGKELDAVLGNKYAEHLETKRDEIRELLTHAR